MFSILSQLQYLVSCFFSCHYTDEIIKIYCLSSGVDACTEELDQRGSERIMSAETLESRKYAFETESRTIFELLKDQFDTPAKAMRELVQNALAANASHIYITTSLRNNIFKIVVEDDGLGMSEQERDEKLLKMGNFGKEAEPDIPGEYGMGFHSVFAYDPFEVIVTSKAADQISWQARIDRQGEGTIETDVAPSLASLTGDPKSYTQIIIKKKIEGAQEAQYLTNQARQELIQSCKYVSVSIQFNDRKVSQVPFDLSGPRIRYSDEQGRQAVIKKKKGGGELQLYSHKIKVGHLNRTQEEFPYSFQIMLDDPNLRPVISRNQVKRDENYTRAMTRLREAVDSFEVTVFEYLNQFLDSSSNRDKTVHDIKVDHLYEYAGRYLKRTVMPRSSEQPNFFSTSDSLNRVPQQALSTIIFRTIGGERISLKQLLEFARQGSLYVASEQTRITNRFQGREQIIYLHHPAAKILLDKVSRLFSPRGPTDVNSEYYTPPILDNFEGEFSHFQGMVDSLEDCFPNVKLFLGEYDPQESFGELEDIYVVPYHWKYLDTCVWKNNQSHEYTAILNLSSDSIQNLLRLSEERPQVGKEMTGWKLSSILEKNLEEDIISRFQFRLT